MSPSGLLAGSVREARGERVSHPSLSPAWGVHIFGVPLSYSVAWELQLRLHDERVRRTRPDSLLILEHQPVYTLGRGTLPSHWSGDGLTLRTNGAELQTVNRGGSVTYHGPGQVVAYPIVKLVRYAAGPRRFIHLLEEVVIHVLRTRGIDGYRVPKKPGVWVRAPDERKIASIGLRVDRGVTLHGLSLNVDLDLTSFSAIIPCGLSGCRMTSMAEVLDGPVPIEPVKEQMAHSFGEVFSVDGSRFTGTAGRS